MILSEIHIKYLKLGVWMVLFHTVPIVLVVYYFFKLFTSKVDAEFMILFALSFAALAFRWSTISPDFDLYRHKAFVSYSATQPFTAQIGHSLINISPLRSISMILIGRLGNPNYLQAIYVYLILWHSLKIASVYFEEETPRENGLIFSILFFSLYVLGVFSSLFYILSMLLFVRGVYSFKEGQIKYAIVYSVVAVLLHFSTFFIVVLYAAFMYIDSRFKGKRLWVGLGLILSVFLLIYLGTPLVAWINSQLNDGLFRSFTARYMTYVEDQKSIGVFSNITFLATDYSKCILVIVVFTHINKIKLHQTKYEDRSLFIAFLFAVLVLTVGLRIRVLTRFALIPLVLILPSLTKLIKKTHEQTIVYRYLGVYMAYQVVYHIYSLYNAGVLF